jgi:hypothetical protein
MTQSQNHHGGQIGSIHQVDIGKIFVPIYHSIKF